MMADAEFQYLSDLEKRMEGLQEDLQDIEDQIQNGPKEARIKFAQLERFVDRKRTVIRQRLDRARQEDGESWPDLKSSLDRALEELRGSIEKAREELRG